MSFLLSLFWPIELFAELFGGDLVLRRLNIELFAELFAEVCFADSIGKSTSKSSAHDSAIRTQWF